MNQIPREQLHAYLDDALDDTETAQVEKVLRESEALRRLLRSIMQERDRGEHSIGAVWRRERLSCPTREQLGSYLLQALDEMDHTIDRSEGHGGPGDGGDWRGLRDRARAVRARRGCGRPGSRGRHRRAQADLDRRQRRRATVRGRHRDGASPEMLWGRRVL